MSIPITIESVYLRLCTTSMNRPKWTWANSSSKTRGRPDAPSFTRLRIAASAWIPLLFPDEFGPMKSVRGRMGRLIRLAIP